MQVPLGAGFFQHVEGADRVLAAGPPDGELHGERRDAQDEQKEQVEQDKQAAAVLPGDEREPPDVSDPDGAPGTDEEEAEARPEVFPRSGSGGFLSQNKVSFHWNRGIIPSFGRKGARQGQKAVAFVLPGGKLQPFLSSEVKDRPDGDDQTEDDDVEVAEAPVLLRHAEVHTEPAGDQGERA